MMRVLLKDIYGWETGLIERFLKELPEQVMARVDEMVEKVS